MTSNNSMIRLNTEVRKTEKSRELVKLSRSVKFEPAISSLMFLPLGHVRLTIDKHLPQIKQRTDAMKSPMLQVVIIAKVP